MQPKQTTKRPTSANFHELMAALLQSMKIQAQPQPSEVYSFVFSGTTEVNIFSPQPDAVDILVVLGTLNKPNTSEILLDLLGMNRYARTDPLMSIGVDPVTGKATLWTRRSLPELDLHQMTSLLSRVLEYASIAQGHLQRAEAQTDRGTARQHQQGRRIILDSIPQQHQQA